MNILVFKTSVSNSNTITRLKPLLDSIAGINQWNFDLEDCDRILRVTSHQTTPHCIIHLLADHGYQCAELED